MSITSPVAGVTTKIEKTTYVTYVAGIPGRPAVPAHTITLTAQAPSDTHLPPGWSYALVEYPPSDVGNYGSPPQLVATAPPGFTEGGEALV